MTITQQSFMGFDVPEHARFRRTDPITSIDTVTNPVIAARLRANCAIVLRAFATSANNGMNAHEVAEKCGLNRIEVSRRAAELEKADLVERTGERRVLETGNKGIVRRCTSAGLLALRDGAK